MSDARRRVVVDIAGTSRLWTLPEWGRERLLAETPDGWETIVVKDATPLAQEVGSSSSREALAVASEAEVYFGFGIIPDFFHAAPKLRWVHSAAAGVGKSLFPELRDSDIPLTNSSGTMADPIGEYAVAGILHFLRGFDIALRLQQEGRWDQHAFMVDAAEIRELCECRVVIVGTGGLGGAIARRLSALGAECIGVRRRAGVGDVVPDGFSRTVGGDGLDALLPDADTIVMATPLTPETRGLLSAYRLAALPRRAIVVNVGRGPLIDEDALAERVRSGQIRGAVLDVFHEEPLPASSPLWGVRGILMTPHVAAVSPRLYWERTLGLFLENWRRYRSGEPLRNVVDKDAGY